MKTKEQKRFHAIVCTKVDKDSGGNGRGGVGGHLKPQKGVLRPKWFPQHGKQGRRFPYLCSKEMASQKVAKIVKKSARYAENCIKMQKRGQKW